LEDLGVDVKIVLKWNKYDVAMWTAFSLAQSSVAVRAVMW